MKPHPSKRAALVACRHSAQQLRGVQMLPASESQAAVCRAGCSIAARCMQQNAAAAPHLILRQQVGGQHLHVPPAAAPAGVCTLALQVVHLACGHLQAVSGRCRHGGQQAAAAAGVQQASPGCRVAPQLHACSMLST